MYSFFFLLISSSGISLFVFSGVNQPTFRESALDKLRFFPHLKLVKEPAFQKPADATKRLFENCTPEIKALAKKARGELRQRARRQWSLRQDAGSPVRH